MSIARGTAHIASVEDGKDAVRYEIVPGTYAVSLDAEGNWVDGTTVNESGRAVVAFSIVEVTGSERKKVPLDFVYCNDDSADQSDMGEYVCYIGKEAASAVISAYETTVQTISGIKRKVQGDLLARCSIIVNRAGANGTSVNIQFSVDGTNWHDAYAKGDVYMRIRNGAGWSAAIKFVGDNGTSFNPKGVADGHFGKASEISTAFQFWKMLVDVNDKYPLASSSPSIIEKTPNGYTATKANVGDGYVVGGRIWVCSEKDGWVDFGNIRGADGESVYVTENSVTYGISGDPKNPASVKAWTSSIPNITAEQPYLWVKNYLRFSDNTETISYAVTTRGNRGAVLRQHAGFVSEGYNYQSGSGTEEFIDVVKVGKVWYRCIKSYSSKDTPTANDVTNTEYWSTSGMTNMDFIATQLFLAEDATINMLGTNEINLYDGDNMFGSFRVPHNAVGVSGGVDGNKYALWLGDEVADVAPFSVTKYGAVHATSGSIGSFDIVTNKDDNDFVFYSLHAHSDGSAATAPNSVDLYYNGIEARSMARPDLGGIVQVGASNSVVGGEYAWDTGLVKVDGYFSGSAHGTEQVAYGANMNGNGKNAVTCYKANARNGAHNYALHAVNGDVVAENGSLRGAGFCGGVGLSLLSLSSGKRYYNNSELDIRKNGTWLVAASADNANVLVLPKLSVAREMACNASAFCMRLTIIAKAGSAQFYLAGRNVLDTNLSSNEYPVFLHNDGGDGRGINMASGDVLELALVYDGSSYYSYLLGSRN